MLTVFQVQFKPLLRIEPFGNKICVTEFDDGIIIHPDKDTAFNRYMGESEISARGNTDHDHFPVINMGVILNVEFIIAFMKGFEKSDKRNTVVIIPYRVVKLHVGKFIAFKGREHTVNEDLGRVAADIRNIFLEKFRIILAVAHLMDVDAGFAHRLFYTGIPGRNCRLQKIDILVVLFQVIPIISFQDAGLLIIVFGDPFEFRVVRLAKKIKAGADFVQTQCIFDLPKFKEWMKMVVDRGLHEKVYLLAGVMPIKSYRVLQYMKNNVAGMSIPDELIDRMKGAEDPKAEGVKICVELIRQVREIEGIRGVHIMAVEWEAIVPSIVQEAGLYPRPQIQ